MIFSFFKKNIHISLITTLAIIVVIFITFISGPKNIDKQDYISQIEHLRNPLTSQLNEFGTYKIFKPLYADIGTYLLFLSPEALILTLNAIFFCGTYILFFLVLTELGFSKKYSLFGSIISMLAYPALWYGYALGTDVSGWFFCIATIYTALIAFKNNTARYFLLASVLGFIGFLGKETGLLGLGFAGAYAILNWKNWGVKRITKSILLLSLPFVILELSFLTSMYFSGGENFVNWFSTNKERFGNVHTFKFWFGSEVSTFNILWLYAFYALFSFFKKSIVVPKETTYKILALIIATLPVLVWPIFLDRVLYIQFIAVIPLALYGIQALASKKPSSKKFEVFLFILPIAVSFLIMKIGGQDGLYLLIKNFDFGQYYDRITSIFLP